MRDKIVLFLQFVLMIGIALGPVINSGHFDFTFFPLMFHKTLGLFLSMFGTVVVFKAKCDMAYAFKIHPRPKGEGFLVTSGLFSKSRNPIYLGGILMCIGWSVSMFSLVSFLLSLILIIVLSYKIRIEERYLENIFSEEYLAYKNKTPRWLACALLW